MNTRANANLITFDFKKHRIRISKNTLHALNDPDYILLLVNPVDRLIAVQKSVRSDPRSHHISWSATMRNRSFEIYSVSLMDMLKLCSGWDIDQTYHINGIANVSKDLVQFRIDDSFPHADAKET